jgi:hypothetical protein
MDCVGYARTEFKPVLVFEGYVAYVYKTRWDCTSVSEEALL